MPSYEFTPPVYYEHPNTGWRMPDAFMKVARSYSVLKTAGVYSTVTYPTQDQVDAADIAYIGGHTYPVSSAEATALTAAGYTVDTISVPAGTYDTALYDVAVYG